MKASEILQRVTKLPCLRRANLASRNTTAGANSAGKGGTEMGQATETRATVIGSVEFGEAFGLYEAMTAGPVTERELAGIAGISPAQAAGWLAAQTGAGYVVRGTDGRYANYCRVG
jgi:hypothetical protein